LETSDLDINLWDAFIKGDKDSFCQLFRRYYSILYNYGIKLSGKPDLTEDCIQELFAEIWQSKNPAPCFSVKAYLIKALKYKMIRSLKQQAAALTKNNNGEDAFFELSHETLLIEKQMHQEKATRALTALQQLSPRQREIIYLKYFQNLSYEEISEIMTINYQAARNLVYQSIKQLKNELSVFYTYQK
jgi:RNA polymerase sigma-70 factor (ECF subfamily)